MALAAPAFAQEKACSPAESSAAEKAADRIVNWDQLYKTWQQYRHCDKGPVQEVFTEALLRCIVEWKHVEGLSGPMEKDKDYRDFVYKHLSSPAAKADVESVYSRAKMNCPKGMDAFCSQIATAVKPFAGMEMPATAPSAPPKK
jgi:hypothetical protein